MRPIRLVIADRRPIVLQGFATLFAAERDFAIVASCLDGAGCLKAIRKLTPDVVLVEDGFADVTASQMLAVIRAENIPTRLVFYTASAAHGDLAAAIAAGACCAVSMREKPERLMQTLKLVAPAHDRATAGKEENGALGENGLALTGQERKIMRLVAYGMSNKQIARQLKVSTGTIKARLDHISTQLEIKGRREVAAFALSRLYGGLGALAALIYAALDDVKAARASASGHETPDTFAVMTADGAGEVITIRINAKKTAAASGKTVKALFKAGREENPINEASGRAEKPIQSGIDIGAGSINLPAFSSARPASGSFSTFMMTAVGIWFYELLNSVAQASNLGDRATVDAAATANGPGGSAAPNSPGSGDGHLVTFDNLAWLHPETYDQSFAFVAAGSETFARDSDGAQIIAAYTREDGAGSNGNPHVGSGAIDAVLDQGGAEQGAATGAPGHAGRDSLHEAAGDGSNHGQSQRDLKAAEGDGPPDKQQDNSGAPKDDSNHRQLQRDLAHSKDDAKQHSKQDVPAGDADHAQSQHDLHASQGHPSAADQHAKKDAGKASEDHSGQSQQELHDKPAKDSLPAGPSQHAGGKDRATEHSGQAQKAAASEPGDSFHFKNEIAPPQASHSSGVHGGHGPDSNEHGPHAGANSDLIAVHDAELLDPSSAEQCAIAHGQSATHHPMHDLLV
ncbi:VCBS domain-containing protein [Bradyrhizobium diazoefficiens]|nr:LuxR C-terminal-related transcriptional regulator [Bradyrhizobium diazoefficiens]MBR0775250.1 VCBS domain-containing protein [Bradyrhizobium diazoefficiens]